MKKPYYYQRILRSRVATFDVYSIGLLKHHVSALLEFDVTDSRRKLRKLRTDGINVSFNAWLIKVISNVLHQHIDNEIKIREILNMTILVDHDVIDGAPMVRFLNDLTKYIENGDGINSPNA